MADIAKLLACIAIGAIVGGAGGVGVAHLAGLYGRWKHPGDPSAYSGAIIVIVTFPLGVLLGIGAGVICAIRWMK